MAMIQVTVVGSGLAQMEEATRILGSPARARRAFARAINRTGDTVRNEAGRALSDQTGLPKSTGKKAYRRDGERATPTSLTYVVNGKGGPVSLKYFKPRETRKGVSAAPRNQRQVFASTFMKAGWWPKRVSKANWNGQVFIRSNSDGYSYDGLRSRGAKRSGTKFTKAKSDVVIPVEMINGAAAEAWRQGARRLQPRIEHEVRVMTKGIVS